MLLLTIEFLYCRIDICKHNKTVMLLFVEVKYKIPNNLFKNVASYARIFILHNRHLNVNIEADYCIMPFYVLGSFHRNMTQCNIAVLA